MITKLEVKNFRNISHICLDLKKCSILTGANGIGKSNTLNAANWLITNTLLTDKWGVGENDLNSVFNKNYIKGQDPSVIITLETGITFEKRFRKGKDGNNAEYYINGIKEKSKKDFEESLYKNLKFEKKLKCEKDVNELRLYTDPLYPLQKLDPKALRTLLVELGCSVTNEEVFELHHEFDELKSFVPQFQNDFSKMRINFKQQRTELNKQLDTIPLLLKEYAGKDYDPSEKEALEQEKQKILSKIESLKKNSKAATEEYRNKLSDIKHKKDLFIASENSKIMVELTKLEEQKKVAQNDAYNSQNEELKDINSKIQSKSEELLSLNSNKKNYETIRNNCREIAQACKKEVDDLINEAKELDNKLSEVGKREFVGYVTCPDCGKIFAADESALMLFNKQKQDDIENINLRLSNIEIDIKKKEKIFDENYHKGLDAKVEEEKIDKRIFYLKDEIDDLNVQKSNISVKPVDTSKIEELDIKIKNLKDTKINVSEYDSQIEKIERNIYLLEQGEEEKIKSEINDLNLKLQDVETKIEEQYKIKSNEELRIKTLKQQDDITFDINNIEHYIELVNGFIQTKISLINNKAKDLIGIDFVMLEDNISNDGVKEVCYATVDGVEFGNVNTSKKLEVGIQFIHKIKEILGSNDLPIFADRLEGFDDKDKIRNLTTEQLICTVVGDSEQKEIVVI